MLSRTVMGPQISESLVLWSEQSDSTGGQGDPRFVNHRWFERYSPRMSINKTKPGTWGPDHVLSGER